MFVFVSCTFMYVVPIPSAVTVPSSATVATSESSVENSYVLPSTSSLSKLNPICVSHSIFGCFLLCFYNLLYLDLLFF